ncbi:MAG TPA: RNA polymerase sigma factor [Planctomycetota bacterium]|nr:RNA polymerase sigma factor [Planctomycetota bacterium]
MHLLIGAALASLALRKYAPLMGMAPDEADDAALMEDACRGVAAAFEQLFERYYDRVYHYARTLLRDEDLAADVAQETFVRAHRYREKYEKKLGTVRAWLFSIAANRARTYAQRSRRPEVPLDEAALASAESAPDPFAANLRREIIIDAIEQLPPELREVIALKYQNGLTFEEIASALGLNTSTAKMRALRARELLATRLSALARGARGGGET